jgi:hypothetical protein
LKRAYIIPNGLTDTTGFAFSLKGVEYSPGFHIPSEKLLTGEENRLRVTFAIQPPDSLLDGSLLSVFSIEKEQKVLHYATIDMASLRLSVNLPQEAELIFVVPPGKTTGAMIKSYLWNIGRTDVVIDNIRIELFRTTIMNTP